MDMDFPFWVNGPEGAVYTDDADRKLPLGAKVITPTGRCFRYALVGATDLVSGEVAQSSLQLNSDNNDTLAIPSGSSVSVGDNSVTITNGGTTWTADELRYGNLNLERVQELGIVSYTIWQNSAQAGAGAMLVTLWPGVTFDTALVAGATVIGISPSPFSKVVVSVASATAATGVFAGVAMTDATLAQFCYLQTGGLGVAKVDEAGTVVVGEKMVSPSTAAGALDHSGLNADFPQVAINACANFTTLDFVPQYFTQDN